MSIRTVRILISGLVQGVGFRPFLHRIAGQFNITGWVQNTNENVRLEITGNDASINKFISAIRDESPPAALIEEISVTETDLQEFSGFSILQSNDISDEITEISPDISVCEMCLTDMHVQTNRINYPFVNCTNCGPRFTIIRDLPYDRRSTTMDSFKMCKDCRKEYENITDRRFHAQPIACNNCGPQYELSVKGLTISRDINLIINEFVRIISSGGVVLLKGLGGMHLACDPFNENAVRRLRKLKKRDGKPFALMFRDIESIKKYACINSEEEKSLLSWRRPIVLLERKTDITSPGIPETVFSGLKMLGVMLPYMPGHYLFFSKLKIPAIVLTSGNFGNEPIITDNSFAATNFSALADALILHNRDIFNRTDDSVARVIGGRERIFRRSRGYVPSPVRTSFDANGILAFGAELTNCFCVGKGKKAYLSQHIGDLQTVETAEFYEETISRFLKLFRINPSLGAVDMHPAYLSTRTGLKSGSFPLVQVQHHHAHIASCMAEHRLDGKVIGVAFDGTGFGTDGNTWGSEFMVCDLNDFRRITHFEYTPLPGGDSAIEEPWKMGVSLLYKVYGNGLLNLNIPLLKQVDRERIEIVISMIERNINCPLTSGAGRLFDAVASIMGLVQTATFQAEGPMRLESMVRNDITESYPFTISDTISFEKTIRALVTDLLKGKDYQIVCTKFHNTIILTIFDSVETISKKEGINKVVLSGGVFQNKYLLEGTVKLLGKNKFEVYTHASVPTNDGGIALGQLAVASKRRESKCV